MLLEKRSFTGHNINMAKRKFELPIVIEKDEDNFYVVECPVLAGCYTQGKTLDEALKNIQEVIAICAEEKEGRDILKNYHPQSFSFHTLTSTVNV